MDFKELMDAFAADAGMTEPVAYDKDGDRCGLEINGRGIGFCYRAEAGRLVIWTELGEIPPEGRETLFARLLRENFLNRDLPEAFLSLSDDDTVCAQCTMRMPVCDKDEFYLLLLRFMTVADEWERRLDGIGRVDSADTEARKGEIPSPLSFGSPFLQV